MVLVTQLYVEAVEKPLIEFLPREREKFGCLKLAVLNYLRCGKGSRTLKNYVVLVTGDLFYRFVSIDIWYQHFGILKSTVALLS